MSCPEVRLPIADYPSFATWKARCDHYWYRPHKTTLTAVVLSPDGTVLATTRLAVKAATPAELLAFAKAWAERQWAVEGAAGLGLGIAQRLLAQGQDVLDVPATLSARARLLAPGQGRKTDATDAQAIALVAQHNIRLRRVEPEDPTTVIRLVSDHRDDLVREHTGGVNRLHRLLCDLIPGGAKTGLSSRQAAALLRGVRPATATATTRKQLARDLITGRRALESRIKALTDQLTTLVSQSGSPLPEIPVLPRWSAAKIIGHTGMLPGFPMPTTSPASKAPRPSMPPAANRRGTDSVGEAIVSSTPPFT
jgi:transposase